MKFDHGHYVNYYSIEVYKIYEKIFNTRSKLLDYKKIYLSSKIMNSINIINFPRNNEI